MSGLKRGNRAVLLSLLHELGPLSRLDLSARMGITPAAVSGLVREMIDAGIVKEIGPDGSRTAGTAGRKPILLDLVPEACFAVGVVIHREGWEIGLMNVRGELVARRSVAQDVRRVDGTVADAIAGAIHGLVQPGEGGNGAYAHRTVGVGIGVSGLLAPEGAGGGEASPGSPADGSLAVRDLFASRVRLPVFVDNNVKAMAVGEQLFGAGRQTENLVFFKVGPGVGSAAVVDGDLYRGSRNRAGEIGHCVVDPEGPPCVCGRRGCLEAVASPRALVARARAALSSLPPSPLVELARGRPEGVDLETLLAAARQDDAFARDVLGEAARHLGAACAILINLFDPEVVVLHGRFFEGGPAVCEPFRDTLHRHVYARRPDGVNVVTSQLGDGLEVIGAASLAMDRFFFSHRLDLHVFRGGGP